MLYAYLISINGLTFGSISLNDLIHRTLVGWGYTGTLSDMAASFMTATAGGGLANYPRSLFSANEQGIWLDPSDFSTLFQDAAGTTPVTALGQPVGLALDKRLGLALGPELVTNGDFAAGATGWTIVGNDATHIATFAGGTLRYQSDTTSPVLQISQPNKLTAGRFYRITTVCSSYTSGLLKCDGTNNPVICSGTGTTVSYLLASSTTLSINRNSANVDLTLDSISVREIAGNHAYQTTLAARPTLQQDSNGLYYLSFDGTDDGMVTPSIDFTGTDKMTVWAGVRKNSDAAAGLVVELSAAIGSNNGAFAALAPASAAANAQYASKGTTQSSATPSGLTSPVTFVLCGQSSISGPSVSARINGVVAASNAFSQGTGTYGNYPLYIGRRGGTSLPFNGRIYQLIVRGAASNAGQIAAGEAYVNAKTRAF